MKRIIVFFTVLFLICAGCQKKGADTTTIVDDNSDISSGDISENTKNDTESNDSVLTEKTTAKADNTGNTAVPESSSDTASGESRGTGEGSISIAKKVYAPDAEMPVAFIASEELADNGWVGIIPSTVAHGSSRTNDANDIDFDFLGSETKGELFFLAPHAQGKYDVRLSDPDTGKEIDSVSFEVR